MDMERLIAQWRDENQLTEAKQTEIRLAARADSELTVEWWRAVLTVPKTAFLRAA